MKLAWAEKLREIVLTTEPQKLVEKILEFCKKEEKNVEERFDDDEWDDQEIGYRTIKKED